MRCKLAIIVAHEKAKPGAWAPKPLEMHEYQYTKMLAFLMKDYFNSLKSASFHGSCEVFFRDEIGIGGAYRNAIRWIEEHPLDQVALIENHFNAAPLPSKGRAQGTETLYNNTKDLEWVKERDLAEMVQRAVVDCLETRDRGLKLRPESTGEAGWWNITQTNAYPSILPELFFGDHAEDAAKGMARKHQLARSLVDAVVQFFTLNYARRMGKV